MSEILVFVLVFTVKMKNWELSTERNICVCIGFHCKCQFPYWHVMIIKLGSQDAPDEGNMKGVPCPVLINATKKYDLRG